MQKKSAKEPFAFLLSRTSVVQISQIEWKLSPVVGAGFIIHRVREREIKINGTARVSFSKSGGSCEERVKSSGKSFINFYGQGGTAKTIDSHHILRQVNITVSILFQNCPLI